MKPMKIGIAGAGTMSSSMALIFMEQGFDTVLHVRSEASMQRVRNNISASLPTDVQAGKITQQQADAMLDAICANGKRIQQAWEDAVEDDEED